MQDSHGFSEETRNWLTVTLQRSDIELSDIVIRETGKYVILGNEQLKLYHTLTRFEYIDNGIYVSDKPSVWTRELEAAKLCGKSIICAFISNSNILIDTTELNSDYLTGTLHADPNDQEVIIFPGKYRVFHI